MLLPMTFFALSRLTDATKHGESAETYQLGLQPVDTTAHRRTRAQPGFQRERTLRETTQDRHQLPTHRLILRLGHVHIVVDQTRTGES